jgi:superfamily II DNA or RNA helicase
MEEAITRGFLCSYKYYPKLVELEDGELDQYIQLSKEIARLANNTDTEEGDRRYKNKLLERKRIVNKAKGKISCLRKIIKEADKKHGLKYCFTYAPEGEIESGTNGNENNANGEEGTTRMIREMQRVFQEERPGIRTHTYLGNTERRHEVLEGFEEGEIDVLLAMKCLDEGVDIPKTRLGIFTASTGNPRQYIQRRGRLLRNYPGKQDAVIYDMVVIPKIFDSNEQKELFRHEKKLVKNELTRVAYFASLSTNFYDAKDELEPISKFYKLDLDTVLNELKNDTK